MSNAIKWTIGVYLERMRFVSIRGSFISILTWILTHWKQWRHYEVCQRTQSENDIFIEQLNCCKYWNEYLKHFSYLSHTNDDVLFNPPFVSINQSLLKDPGRIIMKDDKGKKVSKINIAMTKRIHLIESIDTSLAVPEHLLRHHLSPNVSNQIPTIANLFLHYITMTNLHVYHKIRNLNHFQSLFLPLLG